MQGSLAAQLVMTLLSSPYVPPDTSKMPEAGVTHLLHSRIAITLVRAPANVAATSSGTTYLQHDAGSVTSTCCRVSGLSASRAVEAKG